MPEFGEWIELTVTLRNIGEIDAEGVSGTLASGSPYVLIASGDAAFGDIPAGQTAINTTPFVGRVLPGVPDGTRPRLTLGISEDPGTHAWTITARAPAYLVGLHEIDDSALGDGDGLPEPGETVAVRFQLENRGGCDAPGLTGALSSISPDYATDGTPAWIGPVPVGGRVLAGPYPVQVAPGAPPVGTGYLSLALADAGDYAVATAIPFATGSTFADALEQASGAWAHAAGIGAWRDEWHPETFRNHTPGGNGSLKCGGAASDPYGNLCWSQLETGEFPLPGGAQLEFWQYIDTETSALYPEYAYDGGLLEITTDGGATWQTVTPSGGYPYLMRAGSIPGPFPAETPVWAGSVTWAPVQVDLAAFHGRARLRWSFGSDGAVAREGWYLDDVRVFSDAPQGLNADAPQARQRPALRLLGAHPAMAGASESDVRFEITLPRAAAMRLEIFDLAGRRVRTLAEGRSDAGVHRVAWDGRDAVGLPLHSGTYYCRLQAEGVAVTRALTNVR